MGYIEPRVDRAAGLLRQYQEAGFTREEAFGLMQDHLDLDESYSTLPVLRNRG